MEVRGADQGARAARVGCAVLHGVPQGPHRGVDDVCRESVATYFWCVALTMFGVACVLTPHFPLAGKWQAQREIARSGVTALKFVQDGDALIGGCRDGVL